MHRSWKRGLFQDDFEGAVFLETIRKLNEIIEDYRKAVSEGNPLASMLEQSIISNLPDGYLQTRMVNINAKSLETCTFKQGSQAQSVERLLYMDQGITSWRSDYK